MISAGLSLTHLHPKSTSFRWVAPIIWNEAGKLTSLSYTHPLGLTKKASVIRRRMMAATVPKLYEPDVCIYTSGHPNICPLGGHPNYNQQEHHTAEDFVEHVGFPTLSFGS